MPIILSIKPNYTSIFLQVNKSWPNFLSQLPFTEIICFTSPVDFVSISNVISIIHVHRAVIFI